MRRVGSGLLSVHFKRALSLSLSHSLNALVRRPVRLSACLCLPHCSCSRVCVCVCECECSNATETHAQTDRQIGLDRSFELWLDRAASKLQLRSPRQCCSCLRARFCCCRCKRLLLLLSVRCAVSLHLIGWLRFIESATKVLRASTWAPHKQRKRDQASERVRREIENERMCVH